MLGNETKESENMENNLGLLLSLAFNVINVAPVPRGPAAAAVTARAGLLPCHVCGSGLVNRRNYFSYGTHLRARSRAPRTSYARGSDLRKRPPTRHAPRPGLAR